MIIHSNEVHSGAGETGRPQIGDTLHEPDELWIDCDSHIQHPAREG